jgi:nucleotide-binding universal stress UspA family protein
MRRIIVPFSDPKLDDTTVSVATDIAARFDARVTALLVLTDFGSLPVRGYHPVLPGWEQIIEDSRRDAERRIKEVRERLEALPKTHDGREPLTLRARYGDEETHLRYCALTHDLVLFVRQARDADEPLPLSGLMKSMLEASGRPTFIASGELAPDFNDVVAIAWNGSVEAARAVTASLPFLRKAREIHIISFETPRTAADNAEDVLAYLDAHGLTAKTLTGEAFKSVGEALLNSCEQVGAGLLVMGAYTHSRLRQTLFGGVTHHVLENARLPLFMAR